MVAASATLGVRRQVYFVSLGGFDTHDFQNTTQPNLLAKLAHAMAYFDGALSNIGGVGLYLDSGFVHMDTGRVRYWSGE